MELSFAVRLLAGSDFTSLDDPAIPMIDLGVLTDEEYWVIMEIAERNGYWVLTKPIKAGMEESNGG